MKKQFLKNQQITLRAIEPEDIEIIYSMENDPALWHISSTTVPYSRHLLQQYIENSHNDLYIDRQLHLIIKQNIDNAVIGSVDLSDFSPLDSRAAVGIIIQEPYRNQGYGKQALQLLCEYAFGYLHINQLYAYISCDNKASLDIFRSMGFTGDSIIKEWVRTEEGYQDVYFVQKLSSEKDNSDILL